MAVRWIHSYLAVWWRGHGEDGWINCPEVQTEIKWSPPRQVQQTLWSVYVCVCKCVVKACCLLQRMRCFFFISVRERSCALRGAGERTWARVAYLCFYELLKIRLAWSNLLSSWLLAHRCKRRREKRGWLKSLLSRICDQWQAVQLSPSPPVSINSELSGQSPLDFTSWRKTLRRSKTWSCLIHTPC